MRKGFEKGTFLLHRWVIFKYVNYKYNKLEQKKRKYFLILFFLIRILLCLATSKVDYKVIEYHQTICIRQFCCQTSHTGIACLEYRIQINIW